MTTGAPADVKDSDGSETYAAHQDAARLVEVAARLVEALVDAKDDHPPPPPLLEALPNAKSQ